MNLGRAAAPPHDGSMADNGYASVTNQGVGFKVTWPDVIPSAGPTRWISDDDPGDHDDRAPVRVASAVTFANGAHMRVTIEAQL